MEITIDAIIIYNLGKVERFPIKVKLENYLKIKKKLEFEYKKAVQILKQLQTDGQIRSIRNPKNKKIKKELTELLMAKRTIKKSLEKIKEFYIR